MILRRINRICLWPRCQRSQNHRAPPYSEATRPPSWPGSSLAPGLSPWLSGSNYSYHPPASSAAPLASCSPQLSHPPFGRPRPAWRLSHGAPPTGCPRLPRGRRRVGSPESSFWSSSPTSTCHHFSAHHHYHRCYHYRQLYWAGAWPSSSRPHCWKTHPQSSGSTIAFARLSGSLWKRQPTT